MFSTALLSLPQFPLTLSLYNPAWELNSQLLCRPNHEITLICNTIIPFRLFVMSTGNRVSGGQQSVSETRVSCVTLEKTARIKWSAKISVYATYIKTDLKLTMCP